MGMQEQNAKALEAEARKKAAAVKKREEEEYRKLEAKFREELGVEQDVAMGKESSPRGEGGDELGTDSVQIEVENKANLRGASLLRIIFSYNFSNSKQYVV